MRFCCALVLLLAALAAFTRSAEAQVCATTLTAPGLPPNPAQAPSLPTNPAQAPSLPGTLASGLVSYWKFDDASGTTVADAVGTNNGTWNGTLGGQWTTGIINGGGSFNGSNNYVNLAATSLTKTSSITIGTWFNANALPTGSNFYTLVALEKSVGCFRIDIGSSGVLGYINDGSNRYIGTTAISMGQWYFASFTKSGTNYTFYLNGIQEGTGTYGNPTNVCGGLESIGARSTTTYTYNSNATIDEVGIWGRALSAAEVKELYANGNGNPYAGACGFTY